VELTQAAQALDNLESGLAAKIVGDLVAYCEFVQEQKNVPDRQMRVFYYSIGAALQFQFENYKKDSPMKLGTLKSRFDDVGEPSGVGSGHLRVPVPIAFTTNFDRALEKIFEANGLCFHVVFPVVHARRPGDEPFADAPSWLICTHDTTSTKSSVTVEHWSSRCDTEGMPKTPFVGPIIVKLHGSPSLVLEEATAQHWIVLSEFSYLQALTCKAPFWLEQQLTLGFREERRRSLRFLGYSISDWNVRLRLYADDWEKPRARQSSRSIMSECQNDFRNTIFGVLGVEECVGDLNDLPGIILRFLEKQKTEKISGLRDLVDKLRKMY
jgi:hypothetical protein